MKSTRKPKEYVEGNVKFLSRNFYIDERSHISRLSTEFIAAYYIKSISDLVNENLVVADIDAGSAVLSIT